MKIINQLLKLVLIRRAKEFCCQDIVKTASFSRKNIEVELLKIVGTRKQFSVFCAHINIHVLSIVIR